jgi:deoxyribonuclease-4
MATSLSIYKERLYFRKTGIIMSKKCKKLSLGIHAPISNGLEQAVLFGQSRGCTTIQIFTKNARQWHAKELPEEAQLSFKKAVKTSGLSVIAHSSYLINIGSANETVYQKSVAALTEELRRCDQLNIPYLVLHPGAFVNSDKLDCLKKITDTINQIFKKNSFSAMLLLENTAGQGTTIGSSLEDLEYIISHAKIPLGICIDTCHAFAAGYDFFSQKTYDSFFQKIDNLIGLDRLKAFHINDSATLFGSKKDRHADIGKGNIPLEGFRLLLNDERFVETPKILETPDTEDNKPHNSSLQALIDLLSPTHRECLKKTTFEKYIK